MKAKDASGLKKVLIGLAAIGTAAGAKAAVTIHLLPGAIEKIKPAFEETADEKRPAVLVAKHRQEILEAKKAKLNKEQKKIDRKIKKRRAKQAEKIYKERLSKGYEKTEAMVEASALENAETAYFMKAQLEKKERILNAEAEKEIEAYKANVRKKAEAKVNGTEKATN